MITETIRLYEYFSKDPEGVCGELTAYIRTPSWEIKAKKRPAVLVIPGGGYGMISDREGEPVALRFLNEGYCAFVLKYTTNVAYPTPLIEASMAMAYIRENAEKYGIDPTNVVAIGFSAGGHLTGMLATMYEEEEVQTVLGERAKLVRPDAVVLSYPVVTMEDRYTHGGTKCVISGNGKIPDDFLSVEKRVTTNSVPAFLWHTMEDNCVPVENSLFLASAYRRAGVPFALHIFEKGWHGLSVCDEEVFDSAEIVAPLGHVEKWFGLAIDWLQSRGFQTRVKE